MKDELIKKLNSSDLEELWDKGCENDNLDPGEMFNKTIRYCRELESKIRQFESQLEQEQKATLRDELIKFIRTYFEEEQFGKISASDLVDDYLNKQ